MQKRNISYFTVLLISLVLYVSAIVISSLVFHDIPSSFSKAAIVLIVSFLLIPAFMLINRIITTRWGSFIDGLLIMFFTGSIFYVCMSFHNNNTAVKVLSVILVITALVVFIIRERLFVFVKIPVARTFKSFINLFAFKPAAGKLNSILKSVLNKFNMLSKITKRVKDLFKDTKYTKKIIAGAGVVIFLVFAYNVAMYFFRVDIAGYSPTGEVGQKTMVRVTFEEDVNILPDLIEKGEGLAADAEKSDLILLKSEAGLFTITPSIKGSYRLENRRTIILLPDKELLPSTEYSVSLNKKNIFSDKPLIEGVSFSFNTPVFKVTGVNSFYNYDLVKNIEKEIICEVNFNYPVDIAELNKNVILVFNGKTIPYTIEPSNVPTRFYIKSSEIKRQDKDSTIKITVTEELICVNGTDPLGEDFSTSIDLPETVKLEVVRAEAFPVESNTYIALLFNRPVSESQIKQFVTVKSPDNMPLAYSVETEYCYAVLQSDFKPNENYELSVAKGIRAKTGEELTKNFEQSILIEDLKPYVKFTSGGKILPLSGNMDISFNTLNLDSFTVQIDKIYRNNLVYFLNNSQSSEYGTTVLHKNFSVTKGELNQPVPHFINLQKLHRQDYKGFFKIRLADAQDHWNYDEQYILCTDMGIIAKTSGKDLKVYTYSIKGLASIGGVKLQLISSTNQVMMEQTTEYDGTAVFKNWSHNSKEFYPSLVTAEKGDDFSFMQLDSSRINTSRFNIGGEWKTGKGLKAFLTPERGVYRPGDKAYLTAIVRNHDLTVPPGLNVQLRITDPRGEQFTEQKQAVPGHGMMSFIIDISEYAPTGEYQVGMYAGKDISLGSTSFKVEDFIPDKIKAEIISSAKPVPPGKPVAFTVKGTQLFGPPAAKNKVKTQVRFVSRTFSNKKFTGYTFLDNEKDYNTEFFDLGESTLDDNGRKEYIVNIPSTMSPPSALNARIYTEIYDTGGRPVSAVRSIPVDYYDLYLGLKIEKRGEYIKDQPMELSYVAVDPGGKYKKAGGIQLLIKHKVYYSILRRKGVFREEYESESYEEVITHKELQVNGTGSYRFTPGAPGEYIIYLYKENGMKTSQRIFVSGPGAVSTNMESAENLVISLDKEKYAPGETVTAEIISPIPGRLFFSLERDEIFYEETRLLANNRASISFTLRKEYIPNIYINAFVIREPEAALRNLPMTSLGIKSLEIDPGQKHMPVTVDCPGETRSERGVAVSVQSAADARLVVAAVDEGILQITQYKTPEPFDFFYKKQALQTYLYSIFDAVLPDIKAPGMAIGGDAGEYDASRKHINPIQARRVKSVALFSGVISANQDGHASYHFKLPQFNGRLRIMAIASRADQFGSGAAYVTVADPIVITPSLPRILAPDDTFEVPLQVYNKTGKHGNIKVSVATQGPIEITGNKTLSVYVENKESKMFYLRGRALSDAGKAVVTFRAECGSESAEHSTELAVRPARALTTIMKKGKLDKGASASVTVPLDFISQGQRVRIAASPFYITQFLGALDYLVLYPYGCSEQIASSIFPMIYYKSLASNIGMFEDSAGAADRFINEGLDQLKKRMLPTGYCTLWPGQQEGNMYVTMYIAHLFIVAKKFGYDIDDDIMKRINNAVGITSSASRGRLDRRNQYTIDPREMYVIYLRALAGNPDKESMEYLKKMKLKDMSYKERCLLASSYALIGDKKSAREALPSKFKMKYFPRQTGGEYDSIVKRLSLYLSALCDIDPESPERMNIAEEIARYAKNGHFGTTHDNYYALVALSRAFGDNKTSPFDADVLLDDKPYKKMNSGYDHLNLANTSGKKITIVNKGNDELYYWLSIEGTKTNPKAEETSNKISVTRSYHTADGSSLNLSSVEQGQLIVATITIDPDEDVDNLVVVDPVPAGFEIENVRLKSHGELGYEPPNNWIGAYEDIRDDRIILFTGLVDRKIQYSYSLRAVTVGSYVIPQVYAEAMYDPEIQSTGKFMGKCHVVRIGN